MRFLVPTGGPWARQLSRGVPDPTRVFVCYRRRDQAVAAHYLHRQTSRVLAKEFGLPRCSVFIDEQTIGIGNRVEESIVSALRSSEIILVVIGPHWLELNAAGRSRLHDPHDQVRREIEVALRFGLHVVPVLVADAMMPTADQLPDCMGELAGRNAIRLRAAAFDTDATIVAREVGCMIKSGAGTASPSGARVQPARSSPRA